MKHPGRTGFSAFLFGVLSPIDVEIAGPASAASYSEPGLKEKMAELLGSFGRIGLLKKIWRLAAGKK